MADFKAIETQEELDLIIQERLNRQKVSLEKQYAGYEELKVRNEELEGQIATLEQLKADLEGGQSAHDNNIAELNSKIAKYELSNLRTKIGMEYGIPFDITNRLMGDDETSITEDAKKLVELIGRQDPPAPLRNPDSNLGSSEKDGAYRSLLESLDLKGE